MIVTVVIILCLLDAAVKLNHIKKYKQGSDVLFMIDFQCRGIRFRKRGYVSRKEALLIASKARQEILLGTYNPEDYNTVYQCDTISEYFHKHYWENTRWTLKDSTRAVRLGIWKSSILKYWGKKRLDTVNQKTLNEWYRVRSEAGNSGAYIANQYHFLNHLIRHAFEAGYIQRLQDTKAPKYKKIKKSFLNIVELNKILSTDVGTMGNNLIQVLFYQALRIGEVKNANEYGILFPPIRNKRGRLGRTQGTMAVNTIIKRALGKDTEFSGSHLFRRTMGNMLIDANMPIEQVAAYLRDKESSVMNHYSKVNKSKMKENVQSMSFKENDNLVTKYPKLYIPQPSDKIKKSEG
jgi:site-specific recombinase XerD